MSDISWTVTLQHDGSEKSVLVNSVRGSFPELTRGSAATYRLSFAGVGAGEVYNGGGYGMGGFDARDNATRYQLVRELQDWAGWADTTSSYGRAGFRERVPDHAAVDSLVIRLESNGSIEGARGCWGVVTGVNDDSQFAETAVLDLELYVLAEAGEFETYSDVVAAFQPSIT